MANYARIQLLNTKYVYKFPLVEDPTLEVGSSFTSFANMIPSLAELTNLVVGTTSGLSGSVSTGVLDLQSKIDTLRWEKTDPVKVNCTLFFYTKTNPKEDVFDQVNLFLNTIVLTKKGDKYYTPGISLHSLNYIISKDRGKSENTTESSSLAKGATGASNSYTKGAEALSDTRSKLFSVEIPGIVYIPVAVLYSVQPIYSKQVTESGYPLWAKLECVFSGVIPATYDNFKLASTDAAVIKDRPKTVAEAVNR